MVEIQYMDILFDIGMGAFLGFIVGYIANVIVKILLALVALYVASLFYLQQRGIISINADRLGNVSPIDLELSGIGGFLNNIFGALPIGGGFIAGFYLGFKKA